MKLLITITVLLVLTQTKLISPENVIYAIDIGSFQQYQDTQGIVWQEDKYFDQASKVSDYVASQEYRDKEIKYTLDEMLYKTERHSDTSFQYNLPIEGESGDFVLILKFCELYFKQANKRKTTIKFGNSVVKADIDIVAESGYLGAHDEYIEFSIEDARVIFKGKELSNAIIENNLQIVFEKTKFDLPKVDALMLVKGTLQDTNYDEYQLMKSQWVQIAQERQRQQIEIEKQQKKMQKEKFKDETDFSLESYQGRSIIEEMLDILIGSPIGWGVLSLVGLFILCMRQLDQPNQPVQENKKQK